MRVHLVIDRSSSMQSTWPTVLDAALTVVDQLDRDDEVQIVAYGSDAQEMLPPTRVGNGRAVRRALGTISVGGGTNIEAGLHAAYRRITPAGPQPLVILLSDGVPNGGAFTADELAPMAARVRATYGCTTTVVGLGNQFDPNVLRGISEAGGGGYHIAQQASELGAVLRGELHTQLRIAARQVRVGVALPDGVELLDVDQSVNATHSNGSVALTFPQLRQAEEHHVVLRVRVRGGAGSQTVARVRVAYQDPRAMLQHAEKTVSVRYGHAAELATSDAALVIADKDLGHAVDVASQHVLNGRANQAAAVLRAHVTRTEAHAGFRAHARLRVRTNAVAHFAQALETLVTPASHVERREVSLAMGSLAVRLLR
ncbi:MAG: VWA domain-containing protein [Myxococcota bacterium]